MKKLGVLFLVPFLFACNSSSDKSSETFAATDDLMYEADVIAAQSKTEVKQNTQIHNQKIIKEGNISLRVKSIEETKSKIDTTLKLVAGYVVNESQNSYSSELNYQMKVKVPAEKFEYFLSILENGEDVVEYKNIISRDVTEEFIDIETRLANKRKYLDKYTDLLESARTIKEITDIQEKIRALEEEIESVEGRLRYLANKVEYSTLDIGLVKKLPFKYSKTDNIDFGEKIKHAFARGWRFFVEFLIFLIKLWPFALLSLVVYLIVNRKSKPKK
jgi:flagellar biosynthesis chaperone FliJ